MGRLLLIKPECFAGEVGDRLLCKSDLFGFEMVAEKVKPAFCFTDQGLIRCFFSFRLLKVWLSIRIAFLSFHLIGVNIGIRLGKHG